MSFLLVFFAVFFFLAIVVAPILGAESRPAWLNVDRKPPRQV